MKGISDKAQNSTKYPEGFYSSKKKKQKKTGLLLKNIVEKLKTGTKRVIYWYKLIKVKTPGKTKIIGQRKLISSTQEEYKWMENISNN